MHLHHNSPRSSGLPMTRNMPFSSQSVPNRSRNMTGIYLGLEGNTKPPRSKSAVPPLARGRGVSYKVRTPAEDRRYKMVECLRIKEEKRGFSGVSPLRNCKSASSAQDSRIIQNRDRRKWGPGKRIDPSNIEDLIRPNPRNFTAVVNSGVTRSERLVGWGPTGEPCMVTSDPYAVTPSPYVTNEVVEEVQKIADNTEDLAGLEECYKRICKMQPRPMALVGRLDTLHSLLPSRRHQPAHYRRDNVGFTVRSYRNPAQAEILAEFPDPLHPGRPKTVPIQRPLVPSPYFFRHNTSGLSRPNSKATIPGQYDDAPDCLLVPRILAAPGAGGISRTLQSRTSPLLSNLQLITGKQYMSHLPDTARSADNFVEDRLRPKSPLAQPSLTEFGASLLEGSEGPLQDQREFVEVEADGKAATVDEDADRTVNMSHIVIAGDDDIDLKDTDSDNGARPRLTTSNSGADIMLGLETDDGKSAEVEIDSLESDELQPEEIPKGRVRKTSIVDKLSKSKESEMIAMAAMENAGQRQRDFEKLINEHQELVTQISRTPSSENIVQNDTGRDP